VAGEAVPASVIDLRPIPRDGISAHCAELAWEYKAAQHTALSCDPDAAQPCVARGVGVVFQQDEPGRVFLEGLCPNCPMGVRPDRAPELEAMVARYLDADCVDIRCWCPPWRLDPTWTPACVERETGGGMCE
jgi:hypothetical protein